MDGLTGKVLAKKYDLGVKVILRSLPQRKVEIFFQPNPQGLTLPGKTAIQTFAARKADEILKQGKLV